MEVVAQTFGGYLGMGTHPPSHWPGVPSHLIETPSGPRFLKQL